MPVKKLKTKIEVEITDIDVGDEYYSIEFTVKKDGKKFKRSYDSDYQNGMTKKQWLRELEKGEAMYQVLQDIADVG